MDELKSDSTFPERKLYSLLRAAWEPAVKKNWGTRLEWRVGISGAMTLLSQDKMVLLENLVKLGTIFIVPSEDIRRWKETRLKGFEHAIEHLRQLPVPKSIPQHRLVWLSKYLIRALVQRPLPYSSTEKVLKLIQSDSTRIAFGYFVVKSKFIDFPSFEFLSTVSEKLQIDKDKDESTIEEGTINRNRTKIDKALQSSRSGQEINIPKVDFGLLGIAGVEETVVQTTNRVLESFFLSVWRVFPTNGKADILAPFPSFMKEPVEHYCIGAFFVQPASGSSSAKPWDWYFEAFFRNSNLIKGNDKRYKLIDNLEHYEILAVLKEENFGKYEAVLDLLREVFFTWEVVPAATGGKIWNSRTINNKTMYRFAQRGRKRLR